MEFHYLDTLDIRELPLQNMDAITAECARAAQADWHLVLLCGLYFPEDADAPLTLLCVMAHDASGMLRAWRSVPMQSGDAYPAMTLTLPQAHLFEREIYEQWNILPEGHPFLKPVRFAPSLCGNTKRPHIGDVKYFYVAGSQVHSVGVGPIHAGVIEPGHFHFECRGEEVMHLEISLGYQHRGIERALKGYPTMRTRLLVEALSGDTSIGHSTAYATLLETLSGVPCTVRARRLRRIALELERLACHTGDLGALAGDAGFLPTSAWNGRIRGDFLNMTAMLCGNRFGRGMVCGGGARHDVPRTLGETLQKRLHEVYRDLKGAVDVMFDSPSTRDRMRGVGVVSLQTAKDLGLVGMAARASGVATDARMHYPASGKPEIRAAIRTEEEGDVFARALVRRFEAQDSVAIIDNDIKQLLESPREYCAPSWQGKECLPMAPHRLALSFCEGWRGTVCHAGVTDSHGAFALYKPVDPSFHNWIALALALRGEQISDFPLCNKSFNLSYCGHDL